MINRWLYAIAAAAAVSSSALFALNTWTDYRDTLERGWERVDSTVYTLANQTDRALDTSKLVTDRIIDLVRFQGFDHLRGAGWADLSGLADAAPQIASVWVLDADANVVANSMTPTPPPANFSDRPYYEPLKNGQMQYLSPLLYGRVSKVWFFAYNRAIVIDGQFRGIAQTSMHAEHYQGLHEALHLGPDASISIYRKDGALLMRWPLHESDSGANDAASPLFAQHVARSPAGRFEATGRTGQALLTSFRMLPDWPVIVTASVARSTMLAPFWQRFRQNLAMVTLAGLLMVGLTLAALRAGWRAQDASTMLSLETTRVREAKEALEGINEDLERRIEERTREREAALAQLHQSQKLDALGQLTGGVAHDFNNLLTVIIGNLDLLKRRMPDNPALRTLVDQAIEGAERGAALTRRMLTFARRQELEPKTVDLPRMLGGIMALLKQSVGPLVDVLVESGADLRPVRVDPNQLELALLNLAVNARDAMPEGGTMTIRMGAERISGHHASGLPDGEYVRIEIADTGIGMDEATLSRAVEPFFSTKDVGKGTGLGLSMAHGLALQSGGALRLQSAPRQGTTAIMWLPVAQAADEPAAAPQSRPQTRRQPRRLTVLVVDDEPLILMSTAEMVTDLGYTAVEALTADRALKLVSERDDIDLVISDYAMPGMTGAKLAEALRAIRPNLPIIIATGYAETPDASALGLPRLSKPFARKELSSVIERTLIEATEAAKVIPLDRHRGGGRG